MIINTKKTLSKMKPIHLDVLKIKRRFFEIGYSLLIFSSQCSGIENRNEPPYAPPTPLQQAAMKVVDGVYTMYRKDIKIPPIQYSLKTDSIVTQLNASYSRENGIKTLSFPNVIYDAGNNTSRLYSTALDQGVVAHECGHMILDYLKPDWLTSNHPHTNAFHEAFADLTAHFYRFDNPNTRENFLIHALENRQGCVGDNEFSCVRNNYLSLSLREVDGNRKLCENHALSKTFSSAVYKNMVDAYGVSKKWPTERNAAHSILTWHRKMLLKTVVTLESKHPTLMDISLKMLRVSFDYPHYRQGLGENFIKNGLIVYIYRDPNLYYNGNSKFANLCIEDRDNDTL